MPPPPEINITNAPKGEGDGEGEGQQSVFLSPTKMGPNRNRSSSVTPSERSRITLVEENADIASSGTSENTQGVLEIQLSAPKIRWIEHLLGIFCIELPRRKRMVVVGENFIPNPKPDRQSEQGPSYSPWIKSVFVLSHQAVQEHHTPKLARCTIDTGNHQGNLVSRDFLVNVLGYPEDGFLELTKEEKIGGISVTESKLIPEGAVYLDWYYGTSTQVFRKMRFLVSPHSFCDLVIGARSIEKNNILGVPILVAGVENLAFTRDARTTSEKELAPAIGKLANNIITKKDRLQVAEKKLADNKFTNELGKKEFEPEIMNLRQQIEKDEKQLKIWKATLAFKIAEGALAKAKKSKKGDIKTLQKNVEDKQAKLEDVEGSVKIASSSGTNATGTDVRRSGTAQKSRTIR